MRKVFAYVLFVVILFAVASVAADEANNDNNDLSDDVSAYLAYNSEDSLRYDNPTQRAELLLGPSEERLEQAIHRLSKYYLDTYRNSGPRWLQNTDIDFLYGGGANSYYGLYLQTVQPLGNYNEASEDMFFWQGRLNYNSASQTVANLGIGYRSLSSDMSILYGANLFYDFGYYQTSGLPANFQQTTASYSHQRVGLGLENFYGYLEGRFNFYMGISSPVMLGVSSDNWAYMERAATGMDAEVGGALPFAPYLSVFGKGYYYFKQYNALNWNGNDLNGLGARVNLQATPQLNFEIGADFNNGVSPNNYYGKVSFNLLELPKPALFDGVPMINGMAQYNLQNKLLQPVQRNNDIVVERYTTDMLAQGTGGLVVTLTDAGSPTSGNVALFRGNCSDTITLDHYYDPANSSNAYQVNSNGQVYFKNLPAGSDYYAVYYSGNTPGASTGYINISANSDANAVIETQMSLGNVLFTVVDQNNVGITTDNQISIRYNNTINNVMQGGKVLLTNVPTGITRFEIGILNNLTQQYDWNCLSQLITVSAGSNLATVVVPNSDPDPGTPLAATVTVTNRSNIAQPGLAVEAYYRSATGPVLAATSSTGSDGKASFSDILIFDADGNPLYNGVFYFKIYLSGNNVAFTNDYTLATYQPVSVNYRIQN